MSVYTNYDQLPLALNAEDVAQVLGVSRSQVYALMRSQGFPTLKVGHRMTVPKHKLMEWIEAHMSS